MNPLTWQNPEQLFVAQVLKKIFYNSVAELRYIINITVSILFDNFFVITWHGLLSIPLWKGDRVSDDNCDDSDDNLFVVTVFCGIFSVFIC